MTRVYFIPQFNWKQTASYTFILVYIYFILGFVLRYIFFTTQVNSDILQAASAAAIAAVTAGHRENQDKVVTEGAVKWVGWQIYWVIDGLIYYWFIELFLVGWFIDFIKP